MLAVCIEASHMRGMGHLFRALNLISFFKEKGEEYILLINNDKASLKILDERNISYEVVDFEDETGNWEEKIIRKYKVSVWLNDKFESSYKMCQHVKNAGSLLAVIDDRGEGAALADIHFVGMMFEVKKKEIPGKKILAGAAYNILNPEIEKYKRQRAALNKVVVTLGGSDTYGATAVVVELLKKYGYAADIIVGANFQHKKELLEVVDENYRIFYTVPSLMQMFFQYDLAVTGGGVTPFEANAAGLPCVVIANEPHEIATGKYLAQMGGSVFAGFYQELDETIFKLDKLDIASMSRKAMQNINLQGRENIWKELKKLESESCN